MSSNFDPAYYAQVIKSLGDQIYGAGAQSVLNELQSGESGQALSQINSMVTNVTALMNVPGIPSSVQSALSNVLTGLAVAKNDLDPPNNGTPNPTQAYNDIMQGVPRSGLINLMNTTFTLSMQSIVNTSNAYCNSPSPSTFQQLWKETNELVPWLQNQIKTQGYMGVAHALEIPVTSLYMLVSSDPNNPGVLDSIENVGNSIKNAYDNGGAPTTTQINQLRSQANTLQYFIPS